MKEQWNKNIHDQLKDFPKKAPEGLLDDIKKEMYHRGLTASSTSSTSKPLYPAAIRRVAAIAAILLLFFGLANQWFHYTESPIVFPGDEDNRHSTKKSVHEPVIAMLENKQEAKALTTFKKTSPATIVYLKDTLSTSEEDRPTSNKQNIKDEKKEEHASPATGKKKNNHRSEFFAYNTKCKKPSLTSGIYYSGIITDKAKNSNPTLASPSLNYPNHASGDVLPLNHADLKEREEHHVPIKLGISIRYNINNRWSLQSGLVYSFLASNLYKSNQRISYHTKQKLHYVGIPLQAGYQIWSNKHFNGYITAGGQVEKLLKGKASTDYSVNQKHQSTSTTSVKDKKLLFSALASIGAEYALAKDLSIYVEPGIHYYFKNGNGLQTHYNEQPLNFHITIGVRFHWNQ